MKRGNQHGFTYLAALLLVAILAVGQAGIAELWSHSRQREKEAELIWIGEQFAQAIGLYYQRSPGTVKRYPEKLEDLLEDKRYLATHRYLRRIYRDPMTGKREWGLIRASDGGVMGVHSLSNKAAIRKTPLNALQEPRSQARHLDWQFVYQPRHG